MNPAYRKTILPSGLMVLSEAMPDRRSVSVGVWILSGARDEPREWLGISHFIEHMMFKGTTRRDARAIAQSLESLGGHLDAFTGREQVCYYARALSENLVEVVDVLADIVCHSRFAAADVAREKSVVREEIYAAEDNPDDKVGEMLGALVWGDHSLGRPILGTVATLDALTPDQLGEYCRRRYRSGNVLLAATGGLEHEALIDLVERHFELSADPPLPLSEPPPAFTSGVKRESREDLQQLYLSLATRAIRYASDERYPLAVLNTLLGGGMSSRLFQSVREEAGLAYSVYSSTELHRDAGLLAVHLGVAPERGTEALERVRRELALLQERGATSEEVQAAKAQLRGSILMSQESVSSRMYHLAGEQIYLGRYTTLEEHVSQIDAVRDEQVADAARRFLDPGAFCLAALGPTDGAAVEAAAWGTGVAAG